MSAPGDGDLGTRTPDATMPDAAMPDDRVRHAPGAGGAVWDVAVIGAGIAGAAVAEAIARRGASVVLVEMERAPGLHATGRSAAVLSETSGHPVACALAAASRAALERPPDGFCDHPLLADRGLVWVGRVGDASVLDDLAIRGAALRPSVRRIDGAEARRLVPCLTPAAVGAGGVHEPDAMTIDVAALLDGYVRAARRAGVRLLAGAEASRLHRTGAGWSVVAGGEELTARCVVNAAGAWGDVVAARAGIEPLGLRPLRRTAAVVPLPDGTAGATGWPLVMDVAGRYYFEPETPGLLISLADETPDEPCDARPTELDVALALERITDATTLRLRSVTRAWAGLRTFAPDRAPVIGPDPADPTFVWLVGQGGAGIKTAPAAAELAADAATGTPLDDRLAAAGLERGDVLPDRLRGQPSGAVRSSS